MPDVPEPRVFLTSVAGTFHAKVMSARLGSEGIVVELRGYSEGPYPIPGVIDVFVPASDLEDARKVLIADALDVAYNEEIEPPFPAGTRKWFRRPRAGS